jgi:hypothetical protein
MQSSSVASTSSSHVISSSSCYSSRFPLRACNIQDPIDPTNNLGLSITRSNLLLITKSLSVGFQILENSLFGFQHSNQPVPSSFSSQTSFISSVTPSSPPSINHVLQNQQYQSALPMQISRSLSVDLKTRNGVSPSSSVPENRSVRNESDEGGNEVVSLITDGRRDTTENSSRVIQGTDDFIPSQSSSLFKTHQWTQFPFLCQVFPLTLSKYALSGNIRSDLLDRPLSSVQAASSILSTTISSACVQQSPLSPSLSTRRYESVSSDCLIGNSLLIDDLFSFKLIPEETSLNQGLSSLSEDIKTIAVPNSCIASLGDKEIPNIQIEELLLISGNLVSGLSQRQPSATTTAISKNHGNGRELKRKRKNSMVKQMSSKNSKGDTEGSGIIDGSKKLLIQTKFKPSLVSASSSCDLVMDVTSSTTKSSNSSSASSVCSSSSFSSSSPFIPDLNRIIVVDTCDL